MGLEHRGCHLGKRQEAVPSRMKKGDFWMTGVWQASKAAYLEGWGGQEARGQVRERPSGAVHLRIHTKC